MRRSLVFRAAIVAAFLSIVASPLARAGTSGGSPAQPGLSQQSANAASLAAGTTTGRVALPDTSGLYPVVSVCNVGTQEAFYVLGGPTVTATTSSNSLPGGMCTAFNQGSQTYLAAITSANTATLRVSQWNSAPLIFGGGGSSGGASGAVSLNAGSNLAGGFQLYDSAGTNKAGVNSSGQLAIQAPPSLPLPSGAATAALQTTYAGAPATGYTFGTGGSGEQGLLSDISNSLKTGTTCPTQANSTAAEASHVLKSSAGTLCSVYAQNFTTTSGWLVVINATSAPASGSSITPLACVELLPLSPASLTFPPIPPTGVYTVGIVAMVTSAANCFTFTSGVITAYISGTLQ